MATLAPSLRRFFNEIDAIWPHRTRGIDGWLRWPKDGISVGHNPGHNDMVHAIDVDRRGIDPMWIINHVRNDPNALWYMIWNRGIWSNTWGFTRHDYNLSNPHTDHIHIEIRQTTYAENWGGSWLGASGGGASIVGGVAGDVAGTFVSHGIGAADDRDASLYITNHAWTFKNRGNDFQNINTYIQDTMNL
jgi:hypothetical protein